MRITTRVVVRAVAVMALTLGGVAVLTYELVRVAGREDVDGLLRDEAARLAGALAERLPDAAGLDGVLSAPEGQAAARQALAVSPSGPRHVSLIEVGGTRLQSSGGPAAVAALARGANAPDVEPGRLRTVGTEAGPVRVLDLAVLDDVSVLVATVTVLAPLQQVRDAATSVLRRAGIAGVIGVAVGSAVLAVIVRRALRPLREVSAAAKRISATDRTSRVPVPDTHDEIGELATELNALLERIETSDQARHRFLAAVSHEVRTPLAVAEGHLELLATLGPRDDSDARATADVVRTELDRLRRLLDDLLAVARGAEEADVRREAVFLPDLFDAVRTRLRARPATAGVRVEDPPPLVALADQARIEQCLANLVDNAIDHNPPGTHVHVDARAHNDGVVLSVADDGPGVDPALLADAFEPFVTSRPAGTRRASGLGLAVVRSLVEAQGGTVALQSSPAGTTVTLTFPHATP